MNQGGWKKKPYFHLILKPMLKKAALIRASGVLEMEDMRNIMPEFKIIQIPNGVEIQDKYDGAKEDNGVKIFLFMARINFKKRILPLTQAWLESPLNNNPVFRFIIAGPDDGDLEKLLPLVKQSNNIEYVGPIYGEQKEAWLRKSIFYVMPSLLEGFATSVLEAASRASIPVITPECNFPEIVEAGYAIETGTEKEKIKESLIRCSKMTDMEINKMAKGARQFISENYSIDIITNRLYTLYANLLNT